MARPPRPHRPGLARRTALADPEPREPARWSRHSAYTTSGDRRGGALDHGPQPSISPGGGAQGGAATWVAVGRSVDAFETPRLPRHSCLPRARGLDTAAYCHDLGSIGGLSPSLSLIPFDWGPLLAFTELPISGQWPKQSQPSLPKARRQRTETGKAAGGGPQGGQQAGCRWLCGRTGPQVAGGLAAGQQGSRWGGWLTGQTDGPPGGRRPGEAGAGGGVWAGDWVSG